MPDLTDQTVLIHFARSRPLGFHKRQVIGIHKSSCTFRYRNKLHCSSIILFQLGSGFPFVSIASGIANKPRTNASEVSATGTPMLP